MYRTRSEAYIKITFNVTLRAKGYENVCCLLIKKKYLSTIHIWNHETEDNQVVKFLTWSDIFSSQKWLDFLATINPNNPVVILHSRWSPHPVIVPIEGAVLFELSHHIILKSEVIELSNGILSDRKWHFKEKPQVTKSQTTIMFLESREQSYHMV